MLKLGRIRSSIMPTEQDGIRQVMTPLTPRSWEWNCNTYLNQGLLSACVGFSWMHYLAAQPEEVEGAQYKHGVELYNLARKLDQYPGENYEGSSILGGVRAIKELHPSAYSSYHFALDLDDLVLALGYVGPVVLGINWYSAMFDPDDIGVIKLGGRQVGGHAILATGVEVFNQMIKLRNSWGEGWGVKGDCWISFEDMKVLLTEDAEACVATGKNKFVLV